jgi:hypothetical protein
MYVSEKEMRDRLKLDSKSDLIGKLVMAYMTIRSLQEKLEGAKNTEQPLQPDNGYVCNKPGQCEKGANGKCYSAFDCSAKAIAG